MAKKKNEYTALDARIKSFRTGKHGWPYRKNGQLSPKQCFVCETIVETWDASTDDPFRSHIADAPICAWVVLVCLRHGVQPDTARIKTAHQQRSAKRMLTASEIDEEAVAQWIEAYRRVDVPESGGEEDDDALWQAVKTGQSTRMEQWRRATYGDQWPHDGKRGWQVSSDEASDNHGQPSLWRY
ncbi:hypothetical protein SYNPS1DRAFT_31983 [Syncephalis pseudoplumigaleata]|uniref:Uncharacterized protein n=1 Tax=Syncephalis pseudoplumigaleata TaxID=1712513 RepID=A0A4P9YRH7_9FUNG|nr:hypothetical protein SYNPS1DRAFT_31983 [Syncephalis pseudoplumigaleata]|eukprot:RKP22427.1 hypothetical protein SYNPS1DRAFT_31983 [Syncephalis pseudoplumigaleata]